MYKNYYHEQLTKISTCVKYSIDAYHRYIFPFCSGNLNSLDYHSDFHNFMFLLFPNCFLPFPLVFPNIFRGVSTFSLVCLLQCFPFPILDFAANLDMFCCTAQTRNYTAESQGNRAVCMEVFKTLFRVLLPTFVTGSRNKYVNNLYFS